MTRWCAIINKWKTLESIIDKYDIIDQFMLVSVLLYNRSQLPMLDPESATTIYTWLHYLKNQYETSIDSLFPHFPDWKTTNVGKFAGNQNPWAGVPKLK